MTVPTLMYCIGAPKAGTSWLYRVLSDHPDCHLRRIKEVHYFDALAFGNFDTWITSAERRRLAAADRAKAASGPARERQRALARDAADLRNLLSQRGRDDAAYLDFLMTGRADQAVIGDITPSYALLNQRWLREMAALLPKTRFIYILRDPVERLWSHCRMIAERRAADPAEVPSRAVNILKRVHKGKETEIARRSDYRGPLKRLRSALDPAAWRVFFYEELFNDDTLTAICRFLGIAPVSADFTKRVMAGPAVEMAPGQFDEARAWLAPQYDFAAATLGRVPEAWHMNPEVRS